MCVFYLPYNVLFSALQQSESAIRISALFFWISFPFISLQSIKVEFPVLTNE